MKPVYFFILIFSLGSISCSKEIVSVYSATNKTRAAWMKFFSNDSLRFSADFYGDATVSSKIDKKSYLKFKKMLKKEFPDQRIGKDHFLVCATYDEENVIDREVIFCLQQKVADLSVKMNNEYRNSSYIIYPFNALNRSYLYISHSSHPDSLTRKAFLTGDAGDVAGSIRFDSEYNADYKTRIPFQFNMNPDE